jgi:hypothetical protein
MQIRKLFLYTFAIFVMVNSYITTQCDARGLFEGLGAGRKRYEIAVLSIRGRPLYVEIARTEKQRRRGLMHREQLEEDHGMLFVFENEQWLSFWMKDTSLQLSIAYLDSAGRVVDIFLLEPFSVDPVQSTRKCRYALEVNRGFFRKANLEVGDIIDLGPAVTK